MLSTALSFAGESYGDFNDVQFVRNYDGDTITVDIAGLHPLIGKKISVRIDGIDTPEIRGKCEKEKALASKAKRFVEGALTKAKRVDLINVRRGKYFRIVARVVVDEQDFAESLIANGLGVKYDGGHRQDWCQ